MTNTELARNTFASLVLIQGLTAQGAARRMGIAPATAKNWEQASWFEALALKREEGQLKLPADDAAWDAAIRHRRKSIIAAAGQAMVRAQEMLMANNLTPKDLFDVSKAMVNLQQVVRVETGEEQRSREAVAAAGKADLRDAQINFNTVYELFTESQKEQLRQCDNTETPPTYEITLD